MLYNLWYYIGERKVKIMDKKELLEVKKFIKKRHPKVELKDISDEFLLQEIKFFRLMKLCKDLSKD